MSGENEIDGLIFKEGKRVKIVSADLRKAEALAMSTRGIGAEPSKADEDAFDGIKELQKEFQEKYCPTCIRYDAEKKDFKEKGHQIDPQDCLHHWTDILGNCWNYKKAK